MRLATGQIFDFVPSWPAGTRYGRAGGRIDRLPVAPHYFNKGVRPGGARDVMKR